MLLHPVDREAVQRTDATGPEVRALKSTLEDRLHQGTGIPRLGARQRKIASSGHRPIGSVGKCTALGRGQDMLARLELPGSTAPRMEEREAAS